MRVISWNYEIILLQDRNAAIVPAVTSRKIITINTIITMIHASGDGITVGVDVGENGTLVG
jgi:hypothetical protein